MQFSWPGLSLTNVLFSQLFEKSLLIMSRIDHPHERKFTARTKLLPSQNSMRSLAAIAFITLFMIKGLLPSLDLSCELQKLPNLFEHYEEHKACHDDSFWNFLIEDYLAFDDHSNGHHDDSDHEDLPFQGSHECFHTAHFSAPEITFELISFESFTSELETSYFPPVSTEYLDSPFQPPKA
jgi:hypothetical protein